MPTTYWVRYRSRATGIEAIHTETSMLGRELFLILTAPYVTVLAQGEGQ